MHILGLAHLDLSPENVCITRVVQNGVSKPALKLLDYGMARPCGDVGDMHIGGAFGIHVVCVWCVVCGGYGGGTALCTP